METIDQRDFANRINALNQTLAGKDLKPEILGVYFRALEKYDLDIVINAISKAAVTCKFFPKPVELIEIIEGKIEDRAEIESNKAFESLKRIGPYQSICFDDPITQAVINNHFGGWVKFCNESMSETEHFQKKEFVKAYEAFSRSGIKKNGYLPGISEIENKSNGRISNIDIILIGDKRKCQSLISKISTDKTPISIIAKDIKRIN